MDIQILLCLKIILFSRQIKGWTTQTRCVRCLQRFYVLSLQTLNERLGIWTCYCLVMAKSKIFCPELISTVCSLSIFHSTGMSSTYLDLEEEAQSVSAGMILFSLSIAVMRTEYVPAGSPPLAGKVKFSSRICRFSSRIPSRQSERALSSARRRYSFPILNSYVARNEAEERTNIGRNITLVRLLNEINKGIVDNIAE